MNELPKYWCIDRSLNPDLINKWFNDKHFVNQSARVISFSGKAGYLHYPAFQNSWYADYVHSGYTPLSVEEFKTLVLKEAPVDNNGFVVGKWYKTKEFNFYAKYLNFNHSAFHCTEHFINSHTRCYDYGFNPGYTWIEATQEEINEFLPDNHPDKIKPIMKIEINIKERLNKLQETFLKEIADLREACVDAKPKFKVGDYIKDPSDSHIGKITEMSNGSYHYWGFRNSQNGYANDAVYVLSPKYRLATTEEIKEFLIRVAKEKGFVANVKITRPSNYVTQEKATLDGKYAYNEKNDSLLSNNATIYYKGVWATILPQDAQLKFGSEVFTIVKGQDYAATAYGRVSKQQIADAIKYIENPPKLNTYSLTVFTSDTVYVPLKDIRFGFGCVEGGKGTGLNELKAILAAFGENDF